MKRLARHCECSDLASRSTLRRRKVSNNKHGTRKPSKLSRGRDFKALKRQTQLDAVRLLQSWAADPKLRSVLAVGRVLEAALLISGGRHRQLEALDNDGQGRPLTMGRPAYKGTELQRAANRLLMTFEHKDFEAMESADRRRAIGQYAIDADMRVSSIFQLDASMPLQSPTVSGSPSSDAGRAQTSAGNRTHYGDSPSAPSPLPLSFLSSSSLSSLPQQRPLREGP